MRSKERATKSGSGMAAKAKQNPAIDDTTIGLRMELPMARHAEVQPGWSRLEQLASRMASVSGEMKMEVKASVRAT